MGASSSPPTIPMSAKFTFLAADRHETPRKTLKKGHQANIILLIFQLHELATTKCLKSSKGIWDTRKRRQGTTADPRPTYGQSLQSTHILANEVSLRGFQLLQIISGHPKRTKFHVRIWVIGPSWTKIHSKF